jgi:anti-sigma-K factor RskA
MNYRQPELRDRLAAEYVLGTLHSRARARFQRLLRDDLELRNRVAFWERELTPMASTLSVAPPSANLWQGIAERVAPRELDVPTRQGWIFRWFDLRTLGSLAAGLFLGVAATLLGPALLVTGPSNVAETQLPESYAGVLATADGRIGLIVSSLRYGKVMDVKQIQPVLVPAGRTLFLWTITANGAVQAIGPVPQGSFVQVPLPETSEVLFANARELALTVEPAGSAPAKPGGDFVYRGLCGKIWRVKAP